LAFTANTMGTRISERFRPLSRWASGRRKK